MLDVVCQIESWSLQLILEVLKGTKFVDGESVSTRLSPEHRVPCMAGRNLRALVTKECEICGLNLRPMDHSSKTLIHKT